MGPRVLRKRGNASSVTRTPNVAHFTPPEPSDDEEESARTFMDAFLGDDDDGALSDTQPDISGDNDSSDNDEILSDDEIETDDDDDLRVAAPRKQKFPDLDAVMDDKNFDSLPPQEIVTHTWKSKDKKDPTQYKWTTDVTVVGRMGANNILHSVPGPTSAARSCTTLKELFGKYITEEMVADVVTYTNAKVSNIRQNHPRALQSNKYPYLKDTTQDEIHAFFGLMYVRGVLKYNLLRVDRLYQHQHSNPIFKATMSQNRFELLLRIIQFDDVNDRPERWEEDRFTAFRSFFNEFNSNCIALRIPSDFLSIDETLYPYRGRITIKQYNPNKPAKYGILYRSLSDARLPYTYNTLPYAGKPNAITEKREYVTGTDNYTKWLVKGAERSVDLSGRNISIDRYFTSMHISDWLNKRGLTIVGTLRTDRKGIPDTVKECKGRLDKSTKYFFCEDLKSILVSYVVKKKKGWKNVLVLSSMHSSTKVTRDQLLKQSVIVFYTKGGVDIMDQCAGVYTTRSKVGQ